MKLFWFFLNIVALFFIYQHFEYKRFEDQKHINKVIENYNAAIKTYHADRNYFSSKWYDYIEPSLQEIKQNTKACTK